MLDSAFILMASIYGAEEYCSPMEKDPRCKVKSFIVSEQHRPTALLFRKSYVSKEGVYSTDTYKCTGTREDHGTVYFKYERC